ncbi:UDP-N-acetylenolpyruvoylglucosamine reductase [Domibacillus antri]|uniref:UDP-N-acetylenolpyruvoylglucosamine reductase n=1 Tax=Domibacillus antri TaxID=1714264 RepID=A0A1Q8Q6E7_9BACI|nr:UDP-N-acetylmuramate dehydrogenase [Domibacillus antri]OLN22862.1 UDP-N-acetylenolpyruvoylglucosamine reductase [Domibacillus antri]
MKEFIKELTQLQAGPVMENEPLANHTTMKIGGPADVFFEPSSITGLEKAMSAIIKHKLPWRVIGRGSNLLVSDAGIRGIVIKLGKGIDDAAIDGTTVTAGGGFPLVVLATKAAKECLTGLEFAGGIPASVGGAVYMNAGAHGSEMSSILTKAHVLFADGQMSWLTNEEMDFSYRTSILQKKRPGIVLEAEFQLREGDRETIRTHMLKYKEYRRTTQPWDHPCAGSIFRNPLPEHAGHLIEKAGLKGFTIGGAKISDLHGNFIVNTGTATAADVLALIEHAKNVVYDRYQINMETEVELIGGP